LLAGDRLTNEGDGHEDFPGRNIVARVPGVYRPGEERSERRLEPVQEVLREVIVGWVTGVQRRGEPLFGLPMPHLAMAFAISHPGVTSALLGARTMEQLDDLLAGVDVVLSDEVLDRIDEIVPPGTDIGTLDQAYVPPAIQQTELRRRPLSERSAA
jgi:hypothetical protein